MISGVYVFEEMRLPLELLSSVLVFMIPFGKRRDHFVLRAAGWFAAFTLFSLFYFVIFGLNKLHPRFILFSFFWYLLIMMTGPLYARLCFEVNRSDAIFFGGLAFALQNIVYSFYHLFIARIAFARLRDLLPLYVFGAFIVTAAVLFAVYRIFGRILREAGGTLLPNTLQVCAGMSAANFLIYVFLIYYQRVYTAGTSYYDRMSWSSGVLVSFLILIMNYTTIRSILGTRRASLMENLLKNSEHYYTLSKEQIGIINRKCHDLKHQLKVLRTVSEEEREEYIREAEKSILFYQNLVYTENEALNTILAEKGLLCREKGIDFKCSVDDADLSQIRVSDLYALLGNAIDNAIEYVDRQTEQNMKSISLRIHRRGAFTGIQLVNPYSGGPDLPRTTKKDPNDHGFGLQSIRYIAEKYGGTMEYSANDGMFTVEVILPAETPT